MSDVQTARLLLAVLARRWDEAHALAAAERPLGARFAELCVACDVAPWVHWLLETHDRAGLVGAEALARLDAVRRRLRADNLLLLARADEALDRLAAAGVTPIALKGLDLLERVYPGVDLRTMDDVDLLVRREELGAALAALEAGGFALPPEPVRTHYVRSSHHLPLESPGPQPVDFELHWNLVQERRYRVDPGELFERAQPFELDGRRLLRLDDADLAAHLLLHHFTHYFDRRLKWAIDLELVNRREALDWEAVVGRLGAWGATVAGGAAVRHLRKTVPQVVPPAVARALPEAAWRRALLAPLVSSHPLDLYRGTRRRGVRLALAAVLLEHPSMLPAWLLHRARREHHPADHPLDAGSSEPPAEPRRGS